MKQLLVISSYPPSGTTHHKAVIGGASYTKNTLIALKDEIIRRNDKPVITVLAQSIEGQPNSSTDEGISVKRIWRRNSLTTFIKLFNEIFRHHSKTKSVLIELELNIFGKSGLFLMLLLPFMISLKLLGKKITLVMHEVITDISTIAPHINLQKKGIKTFIMNFGLNWYYKSLLLITDKMIAFEEDLKQRLSKISSKHKKITVIPIAIESFKTTSSKDKAREELGIPKNKFVCLAFGFLAWYKGTDWLTDVWTKSAEQNDLKLIIAGGANPNRLDLDYYKKYLTDIKTNAAEKNIEITGFIPEEKMHLYFALSDVVVFPYRTMMSSSAVLSIAFSFGKPILLSESMRPIFQTKDMQEVLESVNLKDEDLLFPLDSSFINRLEELKNSPNLLEKLIDFSNKMKEVRSWNLISKHYYETIF